MKEDSTFFKPKPLPEPELGKTDNRKQAAIFLLISAVVCVVVFEFVPYGRIIMYPFYILSTWFHEMGHSLTAMIFGSWYNPVTINMDGSGLTFHNADLALGRLGLAAVAAGGLLGTPIMGGTLILFGKTPKRARIGLYILSVFMLVSAGILMMIPSIKTLDMATIAGFAMVVVMGIIVFFVAKKAKPGISQFVIQFLGASACLFTIVRADYLFINEIDGNPAAVSDVGHISEHLLLPYWFWGGLILVISVIIMVGSLYLAFRNKKKTESAAV